MSGQPQTWSLEDRTLRHHTRLISTKSFGRSGIGRGRGSVSCGVSQNGNPFQLFTRKLHGFNHHVVTNAKLVDGDELITAFQPGPRLDGKSDFLTTALLC